MDEGLGAVLPTATMGGGLGVKLNLYGNMILHIGYRKGCHSDPTSNERSRKAEGIY